MIGNSKDDYLYSVGRRIKFGESAEEAVIREVYEETGVKMEVDRLGFVHENFFYSKSEEKKDCLIYELSYFFYMKTPKDFEPVCKSTAGHGAKERAVWVTAQSEERYFPEFFRTELKSPISYVRYFKKDGRK